MGEDLWSLPVQAGGCTVGELRGFAVEAEDGPAGTVAHGVLDAGRSYLIVSLDPALGVAKTMLPAGIVESVDPLRALVRVGCSRLELAAAPALRERSHARRRLPRGAGDPLLGPPRGSLGSSRLGPRGAQGSVASVAGLPRKASG